MVKGRKHKSTIRVRLEEETSRRACAWSPRWCRASPALGRRFAGIPPTFWRARPPPALNAAPWVSHDGSPPNPPPPPAIVLRGALSLAWSSPVCADAPAIPSPPGSDTHPPRGQVLSSWQFEVRVDRVDQAQHGGNGLTPVVTLTAVPMVCGVRLSVQVRCSHEREDVTTIFLSADKRVCRGRRVFRP